MTQYPKIHFSERGNPLIWVGDPIEDEPIITVENSQKWYGMYVLRSNGDVVNIPFPDDYNETGEMPYLDHAPNPKTVQRFAKKHRYHLDPNALELIIGRWEIEHKNNYQEP